MPMFNVLVSICINNHNYGAFVATAVRSALNQTYTPIEVIVVDDGSTDNSLQVLEPLAEKILLIVQSNQGQSKAISKAFELAQGEIIIFLDSDDVLLPDAVSTVVSHWQLGIAKVHFSLSAIDAEGEPLGIRVPGKRLDSGDVAQLLLDYGHYSTPPMSGNAFSRTALKHVMPIPDNWKFTGCGADAYLVHAIPFFGSVASIDSPLGFYRIHGTNRSKITNSSTKTTIERLQAYLATELAVYSLIEAHALRRNRKVADGVIVGSHSFLKAWLALAKLGGKPAGLPEKQIWDVCGSLIKATWNTSLQSLTFRLSLSLWSVIVTLSPSMFTSSLLSIGMTPSARPRWMRKLIMAALERDSKRSQSLHARLEASSSSDHRPLAPLVSICINNHNYASFVAQAVASALQQTYQSTEVIVVDDGSTDDSLKKLEPFQDKIVLISQERRGQGSALNTAFQAARGEIILFIDSDDLLHPDAVSLVVKLWRPDVSKVHFPLTVINSDGKSLALRVPRRFLDTGDVVPLLLETGHYVTPPLSGNAFSRRALVNVLPIPDSWMFNHTGADAYLLHSVPFFGEVVAADYPLGFYRIHGRNNSLQSQPSINDSLKKLNTYIAKELAVRDLIESLAYSRGSRISQNAVLKNYSYLKPSLAARRMAESNSLLPSKAILLLTWSLVQAAWHSRGLVFWERSGLTIWAMVVGLLPYVISARAVSLGLTPARRPHWINKTLLLMSSASGRRRGWVI